MVRKIAYSEDYIITMENSGRIRAYKACCNTAGALREIAEQNGFNRDPEWTNRVNSTDEDIHLKPNNIRLHDNDIKFKN